MLLALSVDYQHLGIISEGEEYRKITATLSESFTIYLVESHELGTQLESFTWLAGTQVFEPSPANS